MPLWIQIPLTILGSLAVSVVMLSWFCSLASPMRDEAKDFLDDNYPTLNRFALVTLFPLSCLNPVAYRDPLLI